MLIDSYHRPITYLRVSVTDRCNFRCVYCMPPQGVPWQPHTTIITYEEIRRVVEAAARLGVREVRLTGGEPLVRRDLPDLVQMLSKIEGIKDLSLTTNGILLNEMAEPLAKAGLMRVNISLDTLLPEKFVRITRGGSIQQVWDGIAAAEKWGLLPVKINMVVMRGVNEDELLSFASLSRLHPWHIRFIELMPINNQSPWGEDFPLPGETFFPIQEMKEVLTPLNLEPTASAIGHGPAQVWQIAGAPGSVGFISALGEAFCQRCNRLRLTADGRLRPCLLSDLEIPLLPALRAGEDILPYLLKAVQLKPEGHELELNHFPESRCMRQIGG